MYKMGRFIIYGEHEDDPGGLSIMLKPYKSTYPWWSKSTNNVLNAMHNLSIKDASVLDFGCAGSVILGLAAQVLKAHEVIGVDYNSTILIDAKMQVKGRNIKILKDIPSGRTFDIILANVGDEELVKEIMELSSHGIGTNIKGELIIW